MEKHYLASANTCNGFKNCFEYINNTKKSFTYILKGGPGTGKSTIMKNFANKYKDLGYDVEYFYCSSDINSLDAVRIPKKQLAIVDGTSPHVTEATMPGIKEKIINVGAFIKSNIKNYRKLIDKYLYKKNYFYTLAYSYLKTVGELFKTEKNIANKNSNINVNLNKIINIQKQSSKGIVRKLFGSYISSNGINFVYDKNKYKNIIVLKDNIFTNFESLKELSKKLQENNYTITMFLSILDSNLIEAIYIENTNTFISAVNFNDKIFENFTHKNTIEKLIRLAGLNISKAKQYHKKIEKYYIKNMDFEALSNFVKKEIN